MEMIKLGKVVGVRGLRGEIKLLQQIGAPSFFKEISHIYIGGQEYMIHDVKPIRGCVGLILGGIDTIEQAQLLIGKEATLPEVDLPAPEKDSYYVKDLIGMAIVDMDKNPIGTLCEVFLNGAQDVYMGKTEQGQEFMFPAVKEFVKRIDMDKRVIQVDLIEGMI